jgi:hypothetical protein
MEKLQTVLAMLRDRSLSVELFVDTFGGCRLTVKNHDLVEPVTHVLEGASFEILALRAANDLVKDYID